MNDTTSAGCPRVEDVSAQMDGALAGRAGEEAARHVAQCPLCGALLRDFEVVSARLQPLREVRCDVDLPQLVAPRLPSRMPATRKRVRRWGDALQLAPRGVAAAGALAAGAYLGLTLVGGGAVAARPAAMAVFDAAPPGALCAGVPSCLPRRR